MVDDGTTASLWERHEQLKELEKHKNILIEELLTRYQYLSEKYKQECDDHEREREYNRTTQRREKGLQDTIRKMRALVERDAFILVLIDGDGMIFDEEFLRKADQGGREAAAVLQEAVIDYVNNHLSDLPSDTKVVTRIYANVKGLADVCCRAGLVDDPLKVEEFARGFTRGRMLFDFVDVGYGKDRADDKLTELFKLHLYDYHCRQIIFGCSHDNGYARILEEISTEQGTADRVTLLEGVPFEKELVALPFLKTKFGNIFRASKINIFPNGIPSAASNNVLGNMSNGVQTSSRNGLLSPQETPIKAMAQLNIASTSPLDLPPARAASVSSSVSGNWPAGDLQVSVPVQPSTWASAVQKANFVPFSPATTKSPSTSTSKPTMPTVPRNRKGQRVDPQIPYNKDEVNRVKKLKMCNVHFLRGECPYGDECTHIHKYKPTKQELEVLRLVARMAPCMHGSECEDAKCIYGHRCPAPEGRRGENCIFGDGCRFPLELHGLDTNVVKLTKV